MRLVDTVAAKRRQPTLTGDISNAFFHADEDEEVDVQPSAEWYAMHPEYEGKVWRMLKQIYGRRKATRKFADHMSAILVNECGLEQSKAAPHLYRCLRRGIVYEMHVDDYHATGPRQALEDLQAPLCTCGSRSGSSTRPASTMSTSTYSGSA